MRHDGPQGVTVITKVKWYASLRMHLILTLATLAFAAIGVSGYVLIKSNQHAQDPAILYRIGEIQSLTRDVAARALLLN